jgi:hypothetical protein
VKEVLTAGAAALKVLDTAGVVVLAGTDYMFGIDDQARACTRSWKCSPLLSHR